MKIVAIPFEVSGVNGIVELREPSVAQVRPFMDLMKGDVQTFLLEVLNISLYSDGVAVDKALEKIGLSDLTKLTPLVTEMLGFDKDDEETDNDENTPEVKLKAAPKG